MPETKPTPPKDAPSQPCSCVQNPFADLPPDLQPKKKSWKTGFREVTCPGCGLEYWTNMEGDLCMDCQKKGIRIPPKEQTK
jgi:hypothetical protein